MRWARHTDRHGEDPFVLQLMAVRLLLPRWLCHPVAELLVLGEDV